jgi:hypothetical protein
LIRQIIFSNGGWRVLQGGIRQASSLIGEMLLFCRDLGRSGRMHSAKAARPSPHQDRKDADGQLF